MTWELSQTEPAEAEREALFLNVNQNRGPEYAERWYAGLLKTIRTIAEFPGPRSFPSSFTESERRREEIRYRIYAGPDKKNAPSVSCHVFFAVFDARQGEESGRVLILRVVRFVGETASELLGNAPDA